MAGDWSRRELAEWVRGKLIYARDAQANTVAPPDWLLAASAGLGPNDDSASALETTHPEDRQRLIGSFIDALGEPGRPVPARLRAHEDGRWLVIDIAWLNQLDNEDVGCLVCTLQEVDGPVVAPAVSEVGDHQSARWIVMDLDGRGVVRSVEGKVAETIGYRPDEIVGHLLSEVLHHDTLADAVANWVAVTAEVGATSTSRRPWVHKDGSLVWLESSYLNRGGDSILAVVWDITERRAQERELADLTAQFRVLADEVPAAVFRCAPDGSVLFHNARWTQLVEERPGVARLHDLVHPDDTGRLAEALERAVGDVAGERRTLDVRNRDGSAVWRLAVRGAGDGATGNPTVVGSIEDVTTTVRLHRQARQDQLTGLLNRQGLDEAIDRALADDAGATLVVFIDLDGFKAVNDDHGHDAGDLVLAEIGRRLAAAVRPGDAIARYGGDEFVVVCADAGPDDDALTRRLEEALAGPILFPGGRWSPSASLGTARPEPGEDAASVLRRADRAMFGVKRNRSAAR